MAAIAAGQLDDLRKRLAAPKPRPLEWRDRFADRFSFDPEVQTSIGEAIKRFTLTANGDAAADDKEASAALTGPAADDARSESETTEPPARRTVLVSHLRGWDDLSSLQEIWKDRLDVQRREAASREESLEAHIESFLREKEQQAKARGLSIGRAYALRLHLLLFQDWLGKDMAVKGIDAKTVAAYRSYLLDRVTTGKWSRTTANHYFSTTKSFIKWLWQVEAIPTLPRNLDGKSQALKIGRRTPRVLTYTKAEIRELLQKATNRTRLYILLMLNAAMTQKDIADLRVEEVDWEQGRITRKRSKTGHIESVPVVSYKLWPETLRLLAQERAPDSSDRVLLNESGASLWSEELGADGKYRKTDNIKNAFDRLRKKTGLKGSITSLKKTSASMLRSSERYASLRDLFLGHAPGSVADRHYAEAPQKLLDEAVAWLGKEYGLLQDDAA